MNGKRIRNYEMQEVLGEGAFGVVYKAFNTDTGVTVALKQIRLKGRKDKPESRDTAIPDSELNEISLLQQLKFNENILQYLDHFIEGGSLYIATEFVETGSLRDIISEYGKISEQFAFNAVQQTLKGLAFLHSHNILHRDIKAANLLIDKNGVIKIADFGVAETFKSAEDVEEVAGTPYWIAKEVLLLLCCDEKSDIWSVGATFYELLTGNPPYFELEPPAACYKIATQGVVIGPEFSVKAREFLEKCFSEHQERPTAAELLKDEFGYEEEVIKIQLESFDSQENEFSDDSCDIVFEGTAVESSAELLNKLRGNALFEEKINFSVMEELLFKDNRLILNEFDESSSDRSSVPAFSFMVDLLEFAKSHDKLELAMRKLEFSSNGFVRRLIKFFNRLLSSETDDHIEEELLLRFIYLIMAAPGIYPLYIVSSFFVLLKLIFEYSIAVRSAVIELIFEIFNLQKFSLNGQKETDFSDFSKYEISQYMACSDICDDILEFLQELNTMAVENGKFTNKIVAQKGKCVHESISSQQLNANLILIQNATMVISVVAHYQPLSINISEICELHAFYVECKSFECSFPQTILMQNLEVIHSCYEASGTLTRGDIEILLASSAQCREAGKLCVSIFENSPEELHENLDFYKEFKSNIEMLVVLLKVGPRHRSILRILSILKEDVSKTIEEYIQEELLVCLQIFTMSCELVSDCMRLEVHEAKGFAGTLSQKRLLDIIALELVRTPPEELILHEFCELMRSSQVFCQNIIDDATLMFGFLRNMHASGGLIGHYLQMAEALLRLGRKRCSQKYAVKEELQTMAKNSNETISSRINELLRYCE